MVDAAAVANDDEEGNEAGADVDDDNDGKGVGAAAPAGHTKGVVRSSTMILLGCTLSRPYTSAACKTSNLAAFLVTGVTKSSLSGAV
jgi:hypothetical protein